MSKRPASCNIPNEGGDPKLPNLGCRIYECCQMKKKNTTSLEYRFKGFSKAFSPVSVEEDELPPKQLAALIELVSQVSQRTHY